MRASSDNRAVDGAASIVHLLFFVLISLYSQQASKLQCRDAAMLSSRRRRNTEATCAHNCCCCASLLAPRSIRGLLESHMTASPRAASGSAMWASSASWCSTKLRWAREIAGACAEARLVQRGPSAVVGVMPSRCVTCVVGAGVRGDSRWGWYLPRSFAARKYEPQRPQKPFVVGVPQLKPAVCASTSSCPPGELYCPRSPAPVVADIAHFADLGPWPYYYSQ